MLVAIASHPIQYQIPVWQDLGHQLGDEFVVIFLCKQGVANGTDSEFGREVFWDFELLDGYRSEFIFDCQDRVIGFWRNRLKSYSIFIRRMKQLKPKAVLLGGWNLFGYIQVAIIAKFFLKTDIWLRCEANNFKQYSLWHSTVRKMLIYSFLQIFSKFFYIGNANKEFYKSFGVPNSRLFFAGYGVDNTKFLPPLGHRTNLSVRKKLGLKDSTKVVLFCGKFIEKKRPMDLILALEKLGFKVDDVPIQILFVGSGLLMSQLQRKAQDVSVKLSEINWNPIVFAGFLNQSEIVEAYQTADLLVLPSDTHETWGLVVNEALATGLAVAVSRNCGCAYDLVERHFPDLVFAEGDIDAISKAISQGIFISREQILDVNPVADYSSKQTTEALLNAYG